MFWIVVTAQPGGDIEAIKRAVDEEVDRLMQDGISKDELERVKASRRGGFVRGIERIGGFGGKSDVLASNAVYAGRPDFYKVQQQRFENASTDSIEAAINRWLKAGAYHLEVRPFPELSAASEGADRSGIPETTSFPEVAFSDFERDTLSNGLELIVATRRSIPTISMSLRFDAGFASDQFGEPGTSSLAMAMLDEGTKRRTALQISDELDRISASIGAGSNLDSSIVTLDTLSENLDKALDIYADVMLNPAFPEADLERLRKQRLAQIQQEKNQPVQMALRTFPKLLFGDGHAYAMPFTGSGTEASVARITRGSLVDYHNTWLKPNNGTLIVVGDTTLAEIKPKLEKQFAKWKPADVPTKNIASVPVSEGDRVFLIDRPGSEQSIIFAGNIAPPTGDVNEIALETMNEIIGGSFTSRINMNLREDKSWAYGAFTFIPDAAGQRPFIAYAPVQTDKTMESIAEIKRELGEYLSSNPATDAEMAKVKDNNTLSLPGRWETNAAVLRDIGEIVTYGLPDNYWDTYADSVRGLSLKQITDVAGQAIKPDNLTWVVVGDREKIESRIRELELGELTQIDADGNIITTTPAN
jgi:zinc protease